MSRTLTPPTARIPIGTVLINGQVLEVKQHPEFVRFFFDLFARVGSVTAPDNNELAALSNSAQFGVFGPRQAPQDPADIAYINAFAARHAPAEALSIPNVAAFMPRPQEQSTPFADAGAVLCSRVFSAR